MRTMLMQQLTIAALAVAVPSAAGAQYTGSDSQAANDFMQIQLMHAQIHALQAYTLCLASISAATPCQPPRPLQFPSSPAPPSNRGGSRQTMINSAERNLKDEEIRSIKAHGQCVRTKRPDTCGPPP